MACKLLLDGFILDVFDPMVSAEQIQNDIIDTLKNHHEFNLNYLEQSVIHNDLNSAVKNVDAVVVLTEWEVFRSIYTEEGLSTKKDLRIFDGRNIMKHLINSKNYIHLDKPL